MDNGKKTRKLITEITEAENGLRLDVWLSQRFTYHSRTQWQQFVKNRAVTINNFSTKPSRVLNSGDVIEYSIKEKAEPEVNRNYLIIFENNSFIVVNKPSDIPCHPSGSYFNNTLSEVLSLDLNLKLYLVHRLDRETSGVILFAKNSEYAGKLSQLFKLGLASKEYVAVVHGSFPDCFSAEGFLTSDDKSIIRKKRKFILKNDLYDENENFEYAKTKFEVIKRGNGLSMLRVIPETGRLHQIRATLYSLGFPMVGDKIYGVDDSIFLRFIEGKLMEEDYNKLLISHQALHAEKLKINLDGKSMEFIAEIPRELTSLF